MLDSVVKARGGVPGQRRPPPTAPGARGIQKIMDDMMGPAGR